MYRDIDEEGDSGDEPCNMEDHPYYKMMREKRAKEAKEREAKAQKEAPAVIVDIDPDCTESLSYHSEESLDGAETSGILLIVFILGLITSTFMLVNSGYYVSIEKHDLKLSFSEQISISKQRDNQILEALKKVMDAVGNVSKIDASSINKLESSLSYSSDKGQLNIVLKTAAKGNMEDLEKSCTKEVLQKLP